MTETPLRIYTNNDVFKFANLINKIRKSSILKGSTLSNFTISEEKIINESKSCSFTVNLSIWIPRLILTLNY